MAIAITPIPPFNQPPVDIWGRSGAAGDIAAWVAGQAAVHGARRHLLSYLTACYDDPLMALTTAETRFAAAAKEAPSISAKDIAGDLEKEVRNDPAILGQLRVRPRRAGWFRRKAPNYVEANLLSVPILMADYLQRRAVASLTRARQIEEQLARDAVEVPALSQEAHDFFQVATVLEKPTELVDIWTRPEHRHVVAALVEYGRAVRSRLGAATPTAYLEAARRSMFTSSNGDEALTSLRMALRVTIEVERISTLVTTEI